MEGFHDYRFRATSSSSGRDGYVYDCSRVFFNKCLKKSRRMVSLKIMRPTFYPILCFVLSKDAFTPTLVKISSMSLALELKFCGYSKSFKAGRNKRSFQFF